MTLELRLVAAPVAAFAGDEERGRTGPAPPGEAGGRSAAEDGVGRLFWLAMQSGRTRGSHATCRVGWVGRGGK